MIQLLIHWNPRFFFFNLGFTTCKAKQPLRSMELQKKPKKIRAYKKSVYKKLIVKRYLLIPDLKPFRSKVKGKHSIAIQIIGQRKVFSCFRKEAVDIGILVTSMNGDRKIIRNLSELTVTSLQNEGRKPVQLVQMKIYQSI